MSNNLARGDLKRRCYEAMPAAYAAASDQGRLPAPARQMAYALRRLTGLGDALNLDRVLKNGVKVGGRSVGYVEAYVHDHPDETADWDVVRDARGTFREPHTYRTVPLGTLDVRGYLRHDGADNDAEGVPAFGLGWWTHGPRDRFGAVLYVEKEGFYEQLNADRLAERWDVALCSSKGYSVDAARRLLVQLAERNDCRVLVAHDFDKAGVGIADLIARQVEAVDLGLRLSDVEDERWDLRADAERVTYDSDPGPNLVERGAEDDEVDFLRSHVEDGVYVGRRVELNALVGRQFIDWLESKLREVGVEKVVPSDDVLADAYRRAYRLALTNRAVKAAHAEATRVASEVEVPAGLADAVADAFDEDRTRTWDDVVAGLASDDLPDEGER